VSSFPRFESVIHEFDPYFNYRTTKYLAEKGFYSFHNWFDDRAWYPLGRIIGGTIYPGLMVTASAIYHTLNSLNITLDVREVGPVHCREQHHPVSRPYSLNITLDVREVGPVHYRGHHLPRPHGHCQRHLSHAQLIKHHH
jgi:hypothetical protein